MAAAPWVYCALLRPWQLRWGATPEEAHRDLPGDDLVAHYVFEATRAVSVAAPPDRAWPWIVQMGTGRGGFYALDSMDNAMRRSAGRIRPELLMLAGIKNRAERPPTQIAEQARGRSPAWSRDER